jgi:hypothetical protein
MLLLNFSHPLPPDQITRLSELMSQPIDVRRLPVEFDPARPFIPQAGALIDRVGLPPDDWQTAPIAVILPSLNYIAAIVLAELHGRMGHFPPIARLRLVQAALPPRYEVAEVINLQSVRDAARKKRIA